MLMLTFEVGTERFAIAAAAVVEIVPAVKLRPIPLAEPWAAGVFDYRGHITPVIDLCQVFRHQPCAACMSTRIMVVQHTAADGAERPLGLMAERMTRMVDLDRERFQDAGVTVDAAACLGDLGHDEHGLLQWVDHHRLLPAEVAERLFRRAAEQMAAEAWG